MVCGDVDGHIHHTDRDLILTNIVIATTNTKPLIVRHNSEVALKDEDIDMDEVALG